MHRNFNIILCHSHENGNLVILVTIILDPRSGLRTGFAGMTEKGYVVLCCRISDLTRGSGNMFLRLL